MRRSISVNPKTCTFKSELSSPKKFFQELHRMEALANLEKAALKERTIRDFCIGMGATFLCLVLSLLLPYQMQYIYGPKPLPMHILFPLAVVVFCPPGGYINGRGTKEMRERKAILRRLDYYVDRNIERYHTSCKLHKLIRDKELRKNAQIVVTAIHDPKTDQATGKREARGILLLQSGHVMQTSPCTICYDREAKKTGLILQNHQALVIVPAAKKRKPHPNKERKIA